MNNGYAVILTQQGLVHSPVALPEITNFENVDKNSINQKILKKLTDQIDQQQKIYNNFISIYGKDYFTKILQARTKTNEIQFFEGDIDLPDEKTYAERRKKYVEIQKKYRQSVDEVFKILSRLVLQDNKLTKQNIQKAISQLKSQSQQIDAMELEMLSNYAKMDEALLNEKNFLKSLLDNAIAMQKAGGIYTLKKTKNGIKVTVPENHEKTGAALKKLVNITKKELVKTDQSEKEVQKLRNKKYTNRGLKGDSIGKRIKQAIDLLQTLASQDVLNFLNKENDAELLRKIFTANTRQANKVYDNIVSMFTSNGPSEFTVDFNTTYNLATSLGNVNEKAHAVVDFSVLTPKEEVFNTETAIQIYNTGQSQTRYIEVLAEKRKTNVPKTLKNSIEGIIREEGKEETLDDSYFLKDFQVKKVQDKIDNVIELTNKTQSFYLAFSDKLRNPSGGKKHSLTDIPIIDDSNLLNSLDIFNKTNSSYSGLTSQMLFFMLNQSTASILRNKSSQNTFKKMIENMITSYFFEMAFNAENFVENFFPDKTYNDNVLYLMNVNNSYAPSFTVMKGVLAQLENQDFIEKIVEAEVNFDTSYSSMPLWTESLMKFPSKNEKSARWNYVANCIAANTSLKASINMAAIGSLFNY